MNDLENRLDDIFSRWQKGICPGGQIAVRKDGQLIYSKNFGYANLEFGISIQDETVFHVASVSKQVTVMSVLLLQEEGKLDIDDDVRELLRDCIHFEESVTIRQLMNNVSGIRDQWELLALSGVRITDTITQKDALSIISQQTKLNFNPGSQYLYSNSNFTLLAEIVERVSGRTLNEFVTERIFKPLGMNQSLFKDNYWEVIPNKASSYYDNGDGRFVYNVLNYGTYGATSLNTTANDFLKWMDHFRNPSICSKNTLQLMFQNSSLNDGAESNYAGGLFVGEYKGHRYIEHGGADAAYRSAMLRFLEDDIDIVILSNTQNVLMKEAAFTVADIVFGYEQGIRETVELEEYMIECNADELVGYYYPNFEAMVVSFDISVQDGKLFVKNQFGTTPLTHISGNHFRMDHNNFDLYLGEKSILKTKDKLIPLKKLKIFKPNNPNVYLGEYVSIELNTTYNIIEKDGVLHISHVRNGEQPLYQIDANTFVAEAHFTYLLEFIKEGNEVKGLKFNGGRVKNVELNKRQ